MLKKLNESLIMKALDWAYEKATSNALVGIESSHTLAEFYLKEEGSLENQIDSLIRWQNTKAVALGFATGLGGIIAIPVTLPADLAGVLFIQIRMIAAIAIMNGYDVHDDRVKTMIFACVCGSAAAEILKDAGIKVSTKVLNNMIQNISRETIIKINKAIGIRLVTKFGGTGMINLGKAVPLVGALVGGTFDGVTTNIIGNVAKKTFLNQ